MKKLLPILVVLVFVGTACSLGGGGQEQPTAIPLPTAAATLTPIPLNPTGEPVNKDLQLGYEQVSPIDGMIQVYIPAGFFQMGGMDPRASEDEKPVHKVDLNAYFMDKIEVTNAMYVRCVQAGVCDPPKTTKSETRQAYFNTAEFNDYPVVYVTWGNAKQYCDWAGRRLPSEAEWEYAARGNTLNTYPWGDEKPDGTRANFSYMVGDTTRVGSYPHGASPFGILDMAGNVNEWVNDYYDAMYYKNANPWNPTGPLARGNFFNRVVRGGSYGDSEPDIRLSDRSSVRGPNLDAQLGTDAYYGDYSPRIGFRCAATP